jgi:hypothetical protein
MPKKLSFEYVKNQIDRLLLTNKRSYNVKIEETNMNFNKISLFLEQNNDRI